MPSEAKAVATGRQWLDAFPLLRAVDDDVWRAVAARARKTVFESNTELFREGDPCGNYLLVLSGQIKVFKSFESGRELTLYRLGDGETCSVTTSLLLAGGLYAADAVTEQRTAAVLIRERDFREAFDGSRGFRDFVCRSFGGRLQELILLLESVTVRNVDVRLASWLLEHVDANGNVAASHRELAFELGTAREVVSRKLKTFETRGWVSLSRRTIGVLDQQALQTVVEGCRER